ncbi:hypothetical protein CFP56_022969 [Quercus suber]|uniref:Uncharacterized protein n=1 Tax=Quercus suber TaxID=58331 RepID=A0AAW0KA10_QUESU
MEFIYLLRGAR